MIRKIIHINEEKCNGCGLCAAACHEGAIDIVDGKAKLVRENFCDGFGDCLPNCPTGAITFEEREAPEYDEAAVKKAQEAKKMSEMKQPFITSVFTASSHHPYAVPERYKNIYKDEPGDPNIMHKCIRYVDNALRLFFQTAKQQPWYENTIFVLTADHTNLTTEPMYKTELGVCSVPILIFDPSGEIQPERRPCIAQQIDIMPTVLSHLGYPHPYVAFGQDLLHTANADTWAVTNDNGIYHYIDDILTYSAQTRNNVLNRRMRIDGTKHERVLRFYEAEYDFEVKNSAWNYYYSNKYLYASHYAAGRMYLSDPEVKIERELYIIDLETFETRIAQQQGYGFAAIAWGDGELVYGIGSGSVCSRNTAA